MNYQTTFRKTEPKYTLDDGVHVFEGLPQPQTPSLIVFLFQFCDWVVGRPFSTVNWKVEDLQLKTLLDSDRNSGLLMTLTHPTLFWTFCNETVVVTIETTSTDTTPGPMSTFNRVPDNFTKSKKGKEVRRLTRTEHYTVNKPV